MHVIYLPISFGVVKLPQRQLGNTERYGKQQTYNKTQQRPNPMHKHFEELYTEGQ